jgi:hypothetical protein
MRNAGVAVPKYALREQIQWRGDLQIMDERDDSVRRQIKTARLVDHTYDTKHAQILYEVHILWMNECRFMLQGFERTLDDGKVTEYAQSWLCQVDPPVEIT